VVDVVDVVEKLEGLCVVGVGFPGNPGVFHVRVWCAWGAETVEVGAETIEISAETIEIGAETVKFGAETDNIFS
jgi:hypothetical protein